MARYEDDIIAWLWRVYIETQGNDPYILPYLPMTKVRIVNFKNYYFSFDLCILKAAFNAIEATLLFLHRQEIQPPLGFVVSGVSKVSKSTRKLFVK
jgi:hypothetical protein